MSAQLLTLTTNPNQQFAVTVSVNGGSVALELKVNYNEMADYWVLSIFDSNGCPLVATIPLVTGVWPAANLLMAYQYMNIGSAYMINLSGVTSPDYPNDADLGVDFQLLWDDNAGYVPGMILTPIDRSCICTGADYPS